MSKALEALRGLRKRDLRKFLETDPRVREWLADGALVGVQQAADVLGVERTRIPRYEHQGKVDPIFDTGATKLYLRADLERMLAEDPPQQRKRRNGDGTE